MSELKSKCCGAEIYWESVELDAWKHIDTMYCSKCHEPTEPEDKKEKSK